MNFKFLTPAILLLSATAGAALARNEPTPPPSGIVVHLFGPNSITSQILPNDLGGAEPRRAGPGTSGTNAGTGGANVGAATASGATDAGYQEPTMHQILHEMFVTGDPNLKPGGNLATGRRNDHP